MKWLKHTWLYRMWQTQKILFVLVVLYLAGLCWGVRFQREQFPFLLYGMYSLRQETQPYYTSYLVKVDDQEVHYASLWDFERELITSPLLHAVTMHQQGQLTNEQLNRINGWLFRYIADMRLITNNTLEIYQLTCRYDRNGQLQIVKKELLTTYHAD